MKPSVFLLAVSLAVATAQFWTQEDSDRLAKIFQNGLLKQDIAGRHYSASGLKLLKVSPSADAVKSACDLAKTADLKNIATLYHAASLTGDLSGCPLKTDGVKETIEAVAKDPAATAETIFYALSVADRLSINVNKAAFDTALTNAIKTTTPSNLAFALNAAALLEPTQVAKYKATASSLVRQSDLVDKKYRQYDDVVVTANAVQGVLAIGNSADISAEQASQFAAYLLSRKHISTEIGAFRLLSAIGSLVNNQHRVPVSIGFVGGSAFEFGKVAKVHVSNAFGLPVTVSAVKANIANGNNVLAQGITLTKADGTGLVYDLPLDKVPTVGFFTVVVSVESTDKRVATASETLTLKVVQDITIENFKVAFVDKDATPSGANLNSVAAFSKLGKVLESDHTKRVYASLSLKTKTGGKPTKAHQVFAVFTHSTGAETIFTFDNQGSGNYVLDVYLAKSYKDFDGLSGKYSARVIVGDALIKNPIDFVFADLSLTLPAVTAPVVPKSEQVNYEPLKEIVHVFRQPDSRPPSVVSDFFTLVCLAPLGILVILWLRIGINFGNMPVSPWVLIFHVGLAALFGLYFVFWLQLDMFETLKYLAIVGAVTFLSGNRLLRALADKRKQKSE